MFCLYSFKHRVIANLSVYFVFNMYNITQRLYILHGLENHKTTLKVILKRDNLLMENIVVKINLNLT